VSSLRAKASEVQINNDAASMILQLHPSISYIKTKIANVDAEAQIKRVGYVGRLFDGRLNLFSAPASIRVTANIVSIKQVIKRDWYGPHVCRRLDGWDVLENRVADADYSDKCAGHDAEPLLSDND
jgi:hypothetical protein